MNGVTAGIGSGLLRNLFWKNIELNIVCADFVTNGSLACAWYTAREYKRTIFEPKIYHINRVSDEALFFGEYIHLFEHIWIISNAKRVGLMQKNFFSTNPETHVDKE